MIAGAHSVVKRLDHFLMMSLEPGAVVYCLTFLSLLSRHRKSSCYACIGLTIPKARRRIRTALFIVRQATRNRSK